MLVHVTDRLTDGLTDGRIDGNANSLDVNERTFAAGEEVIA